MKTKQILVIAITLIFSFTTMSFAAKNEVNNPPKVAKASKKKVHHKKNGRLLLLFYRRQRKSV
jgi:hypothetical protein